MVDDVLAWKLQSKPAHCRRHFAGVLDGYAAGVGGFDRIVVQIPRSSPLVVEAE